MLSSQAIFLLAATMFGGVAQVEAGGMIDLSAGYTLAQNAGPSPEGQVPGPNAAPAQEFNEAVGGYRTDTTGSGRDA